MSEFQILIDMGFSRERAEFAMNVTNHKGVEPAMEWLLAHADEDIPAATSGSTGSKLVTEEPPQTDSAGASASVQTEATSSTQTEHARSLKCDDCGKLFKDQDDMSFHAAKSGHTSFSESMEEKKPLTAEEKAAQLALIETKLKQKRLEREERERFEALERERNRIKSGKDMSEARKRLEDIEMKKIIEQRKREKEAEKVARQRVIQQIEADKAARREKARTELSTSVSSTTVTAPPAQPQPQPQQPTRDYTNTKIHIRLLDGSTLTETFGVREQLSAVRVFIQIKRGVDIPFGLMTSFPKKVFSEDDFDKPLEMLGLVPSAVLIVTKAPA